MTEYNFTEEWISVGDLDIDRAVQRSALDVRKVERFVRKFNPAALGVITVSRRNRVTNMIIDGWHRVETVRRVTDNNGKVLSHVFEGLTLAEEAQMFLDLNAGNQPSLIDKFKVRLTAEDPTAVKINEMIRAYGWQVAASTNNGFVQCVGTLERIQLMSDAAESEPPLIQAAFMSITHAWGLEREGGQAAIVEGIAVMVQEFGSALDLDRLKNKLRNYSGGPQGLLTDGRFIANMKKRRISMGVAERLTDEYNKGQKTRTLHAWTRSR